MSEWSPGGWLPLLSPHVNSVFHVIYSKRNSTNSPTESRTPLTIILFIDKSTLVVQQSYLSTHTFLFPAPVKLANRLHQGSAIGFMPFLVLWLIYVGVSVYTRGI